VCERNWTLLLKISWKWSKENNLIRAQLCDKRKYLNLLIYENLFQKLMEFPIQITVQCKTKLKFIITCWRIKYVAIYWTPCCKHHPRIQILTFWSFNIVSIKLNLARALILEMATLVQRLQGPRIEDRDQSRLL